MKHLLLSILWALHIGVAALLYRSSPALAALWLAYVVLFWIGRMRK